MTQDDYKLWTGLTVNFSEADWERLANVASSRLASFLCLETLPSPIPDDLQIVLANWMAAVFKFQGDDARVVSKSVRNFTISFSSDSAANAFAQVAANYGDLLDKYSNCDSSIVVEQSKRYCCGRL